jgi:hypothetical protein
MNNGPHTVYAKQLLAKINDAILFPLITLMIGVAVLVFLWGVFQMVRGADNEEARTQGRTHMLWGVIGFIVMLSALGILTIAAITVGVQVPN